MEECPSCEGTKAYHVIDLACIEEFTEATPLPCKECNGTGVKQDF